MPSTEDQVNSPPEFNRGPKTEAEKQTVKNGVARLINVVNSNNIRTLFFTDQSARPVSWIFNRVWNSLEDRGILQRDTDATKPEIRFINIGRENLTKHQDPHLLKKARSIYKIPEGNILVVDENIGSGDTLVRTLEVLDKLFPAQRKMSHEAFVTMPYWYHLKGVNIYGVTDPEQIRRNGASLISEPAPWNPEHSRGLRKSLNQISDEIVSDISMDPSLIKNETNSLPYIPDKTTEPIRYLIARNQS